MKHSILFTTTALALAACSDVSDLDETESELAASYKANIKNRTLSIVGTNADSRLSLRLSTTSQLEIDVGDDGSADFTFDRSKFERISIDASGGNDVVTMDERFGAFTNEEQITINGGSGNDTITGGFGAETIVAGGGSDTVNGRGGIDTISLGAGNDIVLWQPGDQSDVIEGGDGFDALVFNMGNIGEDIDLAAVGDRLRLTRNVASIVMDIHALERVELHTQGGVDRIFIHDLSPAGVAEVDVDLLATSTGGGDLAADEVWLDTTAAADTIHVALDGAAVTATGLATEVRIVNSEPALDRLYINADANDRVNIDGSAGADAMSVTGDASGWLYDGGGYGVLVAPSLAANVTVNGLGGDDTITASSSLTAQLVLDGGDGNDVIVGGSGPDVLRGGPGTDVVDGRLGADRVDLGDGDDTFVWSPGNASDVVDGGAGVDTLRFLTSNIGESIDVRANGSRVSLLRDIGAVAMDLGGIEHVDLRTRGGSDTITVGTLTGITLDVDLAPADGTSGGDAAADRIVVDGATVVQADGNAVVATGFGGTLRVINGDPALDRITTSATTLTVNGTSAADTMIVTVDGTAPIYDGGGYNILVAPSAATAVTVKGNGGDDWIGTNGSVATPLVFDGGDGNDTLIGGAGADRLLGGPGADVVDGRLGADTMLLGDGDDTVVWDPGDASDVIDGEAGSDTLVFSGANIGETIELAANAARVRLSRNIGTVILDVGTVERIDLRARGGADAIAVGDLTGTPVNRVNVDLGDFTGAPDGVVDTLTVAGSPADDRIDISADAGALVVAGLAAVVRITGADLADQLAVLGGSGADTFAIGPGVDALMSVMYAD